MENSQITCSAGSRNRDIRQACIGLIIGFCVASFLYFKKDHVLLASIIVCISIGIATCAFFIPSVHHAIQKIFAWLAFWVGQLLAYLLLVPLFYLFFFPARIVRELLGKDPLCLKRTGNEKTYWEPREKSKLSQYKRQF